MYRERPSRLEGAFLWVSTAMGPEKRVLPDGCMDLLWSDGSLLVAGPDSRAVVLPTSAGTTVTGLRLAPGWAPWLLGVGADELRDRREPLTSLWPRSLVERWTDELAAARQPGGALEAIAARLLRHGGGPPAEVRAIVALVRQDRSVADVADLVGLSDRQLHRRSLRAFGYGAKRLGRILRLQRALTLTRSGVPFADVAAQLGYADQPHLAREVRSLAGVPLRALIG
jgi:AraC-like DNA-binding protein